jgi:hypothetical protein
LSEEPAKDKSMEVSGWKIYPEAYMNAWGHFYFKDEYLQQFYNGAASVKEQQAI